MELGVGVCHVDVRIDNFGGDLLLPVLCLIRVFSVAGCGPFNEEGSEIDCAQIFS